MKKTRFRMGDQYPWRLSKNRSQKLILAMLTTGAEIVCAGVDVTAPPTHAVFQMRVNTDRLMEFRRIAGHPIERPEEITGQ